MVGIFWNERERRLRAFWRLLSQFALFIIITGPLVTPELFMIGMAVSVLLAARLLDRRPFTNLGLHINRDWCLDLGFGLLLGALLMVGIFLTEWVAGWVTVTGTFQTGRPGQPFVVAILLPVLLFLAVSLGEELRSRGYVIKNIAEGLNFPFIGPRGAVLLALLISSSDFGLGHSGNPNMTTLSTINLVVLGLLFGAGYVLTGKLAIPIGLHFSWNFFQGNVFGFPVSGFALYKTTFIDIDQTGPQLWTGGAFGPEGGLLHPIAAAVGISLTILWVRYRYGSISLDASLARPPARKLLPEDENPGQR